MKPRSPQETARLTDRARGSLLGVAIGDALGAPFEHLWPGESNQVLDRTRGRIEDFHPYQGCRAGSWTDDTGMTLATCRALIEMSSKHLPLEGCLRRAYRDWAGSTECRRPGKTILYAAKFGESDVDAWSNGALMRIAPVAIYSHVNELDSFEAATLAYRVARFSHGHPLATFPAVECVLALMSIFSAETEVPEDLSDPGRYCKRFEGDRFYRYERYKAERHAELEGLALSTGLRMWRHVFEEGCLGLAEGSRRAGLPGFEEGILKAVNDCYDRDTAGAVAGSLLGAYWGESGLPDKWRCRVEKADKIIELADSLSQEGGKPL